MALAPIIPAAPARLSTAIGCFSTRDATWQMDRIDWSAVPPAGQGQMKVIGRAGKSSARAQAGNNRLAAPAAPPFRMLRRCRRAGVAIFMGVLGEVDGGDELNRDLLRVCALGVGLFADGA